jgi:hypothetical protein
MYTIGDSGTAPFEKENDMWFVTINFVLNNREPFTKSRNQPCDHFDVIEVRAESKKLLKRRMKVIVDALNSDFYSN